MALLYTDLRFEQHDTGQHPEAAKRLVALREDAAFQKLASQCVRGVPRTLPEDHLTWVHTSDVVRRAKTLCERGGGLLEVDTVCSKDSFAVACLAAGTACAAVDAVLAGPERTAFCAVRPPGHHATPTESMGFCLFNSIALAAEHAKRTHGLSRVLIVDWDVHHGNGTQDVFYTDPTVSFLSTHRFPFYPGTGRASDTGTGAGLGTTRNVPLKYGISREEFRAAFKSALFEAADRMKPELVLLSAGFDAHREDPVGSLSLEAEDFATFTNDALEVAKTHAQGRLVSLLEGGYSLRFLPECVGAHLKTLLQNGGNPS